MTASNGPPSRAAGHIYMGTRECVWTTFSARAQVEVVSVTSVCDSRAWSFGIPEGRCLSWHGLTGQPSQWLVCGSRSGRVDCLSSDLLTYGGPGPALNTLSHSQCGLMLLSGTHIFFSFIGIPLFFPPSDTPLPFYLK